MKKLWLVAVGIALVLAVAGLVGCSSDGTNLGNDNVGVSLNTQQTGIWVNGEGKVYATPDVAVLTLGIESQETSVAEAQAEANAAMDKVMAALKDAGIADEDIQTQYFSIQQETKWDDQTQQSVVTGYQVTNTVTVKVREVTKAGDVIDAVVAAGGDLTRVNNISFTVDDPTSYYAQAREKAFDDAAAKAAQIAKLAGVTLGKVTYISESSYMPTRIYYSSDKGLAIPAPTVATASVSPGQLEITSNVQITYKID
jgi:hypothetical protein